MAINNTILIVLHPRPHTIFGANLASARSKFAESAFSKFVGVLIDWLSCL